MTSSPPSRSSSPRLSRRVRGGSMVAIPASSTSVSGTLESGLTLLWMTDFPATTTNSSSFTQLRLMSFGVLSWRRHMPSGWTVRV